MEVGSALRGCAGMDDFALIFNGRYCGKPKRMDRESVEKLTGRLSNNELMVKRVRRERVQGGKVRAYNY